MGVFGIVPCPVSLSFQERTQLLAAQRARELGSHIVTCTLYLRRPAKGAAGTTAGHGRGPSPARQDGKAGELYIVTMSTHQGIQFYVLDDHVVSTDTSNNLKVILSDRLEYFGKDERLTLVFTGTVHEMGDLRVTLARVMANAESKGEILQVDYAPCSVPSECTALVKEVCDMLVCPVDVGPVGGGVGGDGSKVGSNSSNVSKGRSPASTDGPTQNGTSSTGTVSNTRGTTPPAGTASTGTNRDLTPTRGGGDGHPPLRLVSSVEDLVLEYVRMFKLMTQRGGGK